MKKIPTLFQRDPDCISRILPAVNPQCQWVLDGEGVATVMFDGVCTMFDGTRWWARRDVEPGKTPPPEWQEGAVDEVTGTRRGWEPIEQAAYAGAFGTARRPAHPKMGATYELIGPDINRNPHKLHDHRLTRHGFEEIPNAPRTFEELRNFLLWPMLGCLGHPGYIEGIVWWREVDNPDAGLAKIKARDFA